VIAASARGGAVSAASVSLPKWTNREVATKDDADAALADLKSAVRAGTFDRRGLYYSAPVADLRLTFGDVADRYLAAYPADLDKRYYLAHLRALDVPAASGTTARLESKPIDDITTADIEHAAETWRRRERRAGCAQGGAVGVRKLLQTARHLFNWSIKKGHAQRTPFRREGVAVIEVKALPGRARRLIGDEETRLLAAADPYTKDVLIAVLETGCRGGELRSLQWSEVRERDILILPAKAKTRRARAIPITQRLRGILEMRRHGPDGTELPATAYVFGNALGEPMPKKAANDLWRATRAAASVTDLHLHDGRREFACRLMESGASAHETRDALGHSNLTMTNQYLSTSGTGLRRAFDRFERARQGAKSGESVNNLSSSDDAADSAQASTAAKSN
jgi:integrase